VIRNLRRIYGHGPRATGELAIELATWVDWLLVLEELARRFADRLDPDFLRAIGCHDFPCPPLHVVGGSRPMKAVHPSAAELRRGEGELSNRFSFAVVALVRRAHPDDLAD